MGQPANAAHTDAKPELSPYAAVGAFGAYVSLPIKLSGAYIVFVRNTELIFIKQSNGGSSLISVIIHLLGPVSNLFTLFSWVLRLVENVLHPKKDLDKEGDLAEVDPYDLLQLSPANFKLHVSEIRHAEVHPYTFWSVTQGQAGRIDLAIRFGETLRIDFKETRELATALHLLQPMLKSALQLHVVWNPVKQRFESKRTPS